MAKKGFTLEQHKQEAAEIRRIRQYFTDLSIKIHKAYGPNRTGSIEKVIGIIDEIRCRLDSYVVAENEDRNKLEMMSVYY